MNFLDVFYRVLVCPQAGLKTFALPNALVNALLIFLMGVVGLSASMTQLGSHLSGQPGSSAAYSFSLMYWANLMFCFWVGYGALIHLWASLLNCYGNVLHLFRCISVMFLPYVFSVPVVLLMLHGTGLVSILSFVLLLALFAWQLVLVVKSICQVYRVDAIKGFLIALGPLAALTLGCSIFFFTTLMNFILALAA